MARVTFTDKFIKAEARVPASGRVDYHDALVPGLALRVSSKGHKTFTLVARYPNKPKNPTRRVLGEYGVISLDTARIRARAWLELIGKGIDPRIQEGRRKAEERRKAVATFKAVAEEYLDRHKTLAKHGEAKRILDAEFTKHWGDRPAADILPEEVADAIRGIVKRGAKYQAHNALGHLRRVYNWAIGTHEFGLVSSPVTSLKPKDLIGAKQARTHILSEDELRGVWKACVGGYTAPKEGKTRVRSPVAPKEMGYPYGPLVRLLILTGQRENEVAGMKWDEIDFDHKIRFKDGNEKERVIDCPMWTIPAERMKGKDSRTHEVPLGPEAVALLKGLPRFKGPHVFTTTDGNKPVNGFSKAKSRLDKLSNVKNWIFHDLRRTMRTHLSALPVPDMIRELVIAHAQPGLHQVYDQHSYQKEKMECLTLWEQRLRGILAPKPPADVADLSEARAAREVAHG
jgi:integrase